MVSIIIKEWTTKIELVPTVQKRNAAVLLRKPGRLAPQYAKMRKASNICLNVNRVRFTFDGHLFNLEVKEWNCLKS